MEFIRNIYDDLKAWKKNQDKKPLLLMGARQIGKTTILKAFGINEYSDFIYLNLEKQQDIHAFFTGNKEPEKILENISLVHGKKITEKTTLIVLDEIQECRDALIALKYFAEEKPQIHIIGAGSLLGLSIGNDRSFPVGKVEFVNMYPLSFEEYLRSADPKLYRSYIHYLESDKIGPLQDAFFNPLKEIHKEYFLFGGMPEVASKYIQNKNVDEAQIIQDQILQAYVLDFVKHADSTTSTKIQQVWNSLPSQLAKENKKFVYKLVKKGARARAYEEAIEWLVQAGLIYKVSRISKPAVPLKAYEDIAAYKLYVFETGLLIRLSGLDPKTFINGDMFFKEFKGALAENYVSNALQAMLGKSPFYWTSNGTAEIDFIIERDGSNLPIEVKSGKETKAKSLAVYKEKFKPQLRIRISTLNLKLTDDLLNIPLFYTDKSDLLISKAIKKK